VFPAFSRVRNTRSDLPIIYKRVRIPMMVLGGWIVSCLAATGPQVISILYDARYHEAGWMLQLLALAAWFQILECTVGAALLAIGATLSVAISNAAKVIGFAVIVPVGFWLWRRYVNPDDGFPGAVAGLAVAEAMKWAVSTIAARSHSLKAISHDALVTGAAGAVVTLVWTPFLLKSVRSMTRPAPNPAPTPAAGSHP
jgi:O-antigen/teichoic acid export membrane protein